MSKYVLKTSIPPPVKCPKINRDEFIRKSELPPNWNKECPAHPDLTNYVLNLLFLLPLNLRLVSVLK